MRTRRRSTTSGFPRGEGVDLFVSIFSSLCAQDCVLGNVVIEKDDGFLEAQTTKKMNRNKRSSFDRMQEGFDRRPYCRVDLLHGCRPAGTNIMLLNYYKHVRCEFGPLSGHYFNIFECLSQFSIFRKTVLPSKLSRACISASLRIGTSCSFTYPRFRQILTCILNPFPPPTLVLSPRLDSVLTPNSSSLSPPPLKLDPAKRTPLV